ncbi:DUF2270 domain-containing protein [Desulfuromonas sp. TF]|jgi:uncharacterized membrane protein|uniref:DUF2270 domain-containing protein n=1 Tax=Desulfuromonas sp. TF TaxID=1232410 RepID=UPI0003F972E5|nr:DUF2270 domain-containing protein [Desulfuromonas sp. TF]
MPDAEKNGQPLSRGELITALMHYYRAEAQRSLSWRERLDRTTNWAVGATAAFLGFGFSHPEFTHTFFIFGLAIIYILLFVESRRYRFYDAYEYRVRLLHQNLIYRIVSEGRMDFESDIFWRAELASDLRYPQYKMGLSDAIGRRLYANYIYLFAILLAGWLLKIKVHPEAATSWRQYLDQAAIGTFPGALTLAFIFLFAAHLVFLVRIGRRRRGGRDFLYAKK